MLSAGKIWVAMLGSILPAFFGGLHSSLDKRKLKKLFWSTAVGLSPSPFLVRAKPAPCPAKRALAIAQTGNPLLVI